jgi:hypothetical protein
VLTLAVDIYHLRYLHFCIWSCVLGFLTEITFECPIPYSRWTPNSLSTATAGHTYKCEPQMVQKSIYWGHDWP